MSTTVRVLMMMDPQSLTASRRWTLLAAAIALAVLGVGLRWGTFVAGGSDSYCYVNQAAGWARGTLLAPQPIGLDAPWPDAEDTFVPSGFVKSGRTPFAISPICPVGLALTMAPAWLVGGERAVYLVVPLLGAVLVWCTFLVARAIAGAPAGTAAALLVATSPIALYQIVQPMSDVPAAAWWMAALAAASATPVRPWTAGAASAMAILTRPNLAPLAVLLAPFFVWSAGTGSMRARTMAAVAYTTTALTGVLLMLLTNALLYGSPLSSGYGSLTDLFRWANVPRNLAQYGTWIVETQGWALALALVAPAVIWWSWRQDARLRDRLGLALLAFAVSVAVLAAYLAYSVFDAWWYLRFLLPAIALWIVLMVASAAGLLRRLAPRANLPVGAALTVALAASYVSSPEARVAFRLRTLQHHFIAAGEYIERTLPPNALVLTAFESGSVRLYGQRLTLAWDALDPAWLDRTLAFLRDAQRPPYLLLERWEDAGFRARFERDNRFGSLDWPPMARVGAMVRIWNPADRERYLSGERLTTDVVDGRVQRR